MRLARYIRSLRCSLPEQALYHFDPALGGDVQAARELVRAAPKRLRGHVAVIAYQLRVENPAYREIVGEVWRLDESILTEFWQTAMVRRLLARAEFKKPETRGHVMAYRAECGGSIRTASRGLSWYISPEVALTRVYRAVKTGRPKLFRVLVPWADVIYWGESDGAVTLVARHPVRAVPEPTPRQPLQGLSDRVNAERTASRRVRAPRSAWEERPAGPLWSAPPAATKEPFRSAH